MLGVGILGAGFFGAFHARAIAAVPDVRLVAVCAEESALAEAFAVEHGGKPYGDWRAMLDDSSVDAVAITAPHHLHCQMAVAALQAGKHVLLEKPMALSVAECSQIMASAETSRHKLMIGQIMHFVWPCLVAREILDRGELGKPITGSSSLKKIWMEFEPPRLASRSCHGRRHADDRRHPRAGPAGVADEWPGRVDFGRGQHVVSRSKSR